MNLTLSEEQEMLKRMARDFLNRRCPKTLVREMEDDEKGYSPKLWEEMSELGWMGLVFPEEYCGSGRSFLDLAILLEEFGRACLPGPFFSTVILGGLPILCSGSEEQKRRYLPNVATGKVIFTMALVESAAKYDAASVVLSATVSDRDFVLTGTKLFVPDAHISDYLLCLARTKEGSKGEDGLTVFIVDARSPGVACTPLKTIAGDKLCKVSFDHVKVPRDNILGQLDKGWEEAKRIIIRGAVAKCCEMVGVTQRILEMTVDYAKTRVRFGQPIGSFQAVQHSCAKMLADIDGARLSAYQAAWRLSNGLPCNKEASIAKAWMNQVCERAISRGHQINSAVGLTKEYDLELYTRRAKAAQTVFGDADFYREIVAREMGL